jgi:hypothetical protein
MTAVDNSKSNFEKISKNGIKKFIFTETFSQKYYIRKLID